MLCRNFYPTISFVLGVAVLLCLAPIASAQAKSGSWLDQPLKNWNRPGASVPKAPAGAALSGPAECKTLLRKPAGPEDRALISAGWFLYGPLQTFSGTTMISAESGVDGMCRPMGFQVFIFVNGRFAGTVSPVLMNSREDGTIGPPGLYSADKFDLAFSRYAASDALCCPSRQTTVSYEIQTVNGQPLLVPSSLHTSKN